ncbi:MAG: hypothetical protein EG823_06930 [Actinobacteria bacterium]|nr:hypothetical protein [Actinomycetota bacterium]
MAKRFGALTGMSARRAVIAALVLAAVLAVPALARALTIDISGDVYSGKCTPCHANYTQTDKHPKYIFTHGNHITYECRTCHPEFPHKPEGTDLPVMKECWNCHGLNHGPQGVIATGTCTDCHGNNLPGLKPAFHVGDWAGKGHVVPSQERLTTQCSMCHTQVQCDECHAAKSVWWTPPQPMVYDAGSGCLACHGNPNLIKTSALGIKSFQVVGLEASAHRDLTCPQCHVDFAYADVPGQTKVWSVNAGMACAKAGCHDKDDPATDKNEDQLTAYQASIHGTKIADGDLKSATCGSCHGGHTIKRLDTQAARDDLQLAGQAMCARCHEDRWENYSDPYHGAAYKMGALDAPACWDCHPAHSTQPSDDPVSSTNDAKVASTCAGDASTGIGCHQHKDATEGFVTQTAEMIHGQSEVKAKNPLAKLLSFGDGGK